jgi:hypothetical protein
MPPEYQLQVQVPGSPAGHRPRRPAGLDRPDATLLMAQLGGQVPELVQHGIDPDVREPGLDDLQVEMPDVSRSLRAELQLDRSNGI